MKRRRLALQVVGKLWGLALVTYLFLFSYQVGIGNCYLRPGDDSPSGTGYLSSWPFGPGCDFGESIPRRPPGPLWLAALVALVVWGVALAVCQVRFDRAETLSAA